MAYKFGNLFGYKVKLAPPTVKHRRAIREGILGTLYATNDDGVEKYFDHRWSEAFEYAGYDEARDPRWALEGRYGNRRRRRYLWLTMY